MRKGPALRADGVLGNCWAPVFALDAVVFGILLLCLANTVILSLIATNVDPSLCGYQRDSFTRYKRKGRLRIAR